jgi:hypothetical protein
MTALAKNRTTGIVWGMPSLLLRAEAVLLFAASIYVFAIQGLAWWVYPLLLLVPDIFMLGYLRDTRIGAFFYNAGHSMPIPAVLLAAGVVAQNEWVIAIATIWFGHIGWDRALGYGLKYDDSFKHTHMSDLEKSPKK